MLFFLQRKFDSILNTLAYYNLILIRSIAWLSSVYRAINDRFVTHFIIPDFTLCECDIIRHLKHLKIVLQITLSIQEANV